MPNTSSLLALALGALASGIALPADELAKVQDAIDALNADGSQADPAVEAQPEAAVEAQPEAAVEAQADPAPEDGLVASSMGDLRALMGDANLNASQLAAVQAAIDALQPNAPNA